MKYGQYLIGVLVVMLCVACTKINTSSVAQVMPNSRWGIAIFANNTEVPQAGYRAMNITSGVLRSNGVAYLVTYPPKGNCNKLLVCPNATPSLEDALRWGRSKHLNYVMTGAVNEWDYKVGLDGEPIAGVSLQIYAVSSGQMVWSSVGSRIGTSRSGLAVIAQKLISEMLTPVKMR
jgi:hypothetical protein